MLTSLFKYKCLHRLSFGWGGGGELVKAGCSLLLRYDRVHVFPYFDNSKKK